MKELFLKLTMKFLYGITFDQFEWCLKKVIELAESVFHKTDSKSANEARADAFVSWFTKNISSENKSWILDTIRNNVVTYARKSNWIPK